jgi:hypothetical protein
MSPQQALVEKILAFKQHNEKEILYAFTKPATPNPQMHGQENLISSTYHLEE